MKKAERLNQELIFLNGSKEFHLSDFMREFHISKRTALRDIQELEDIGVPLYSVNGRYGGYKVLDSSLLPPIYFNEKEILALFFSLQLLELISDTPFQQTHPYISKKLLKTFSNEKQKKIIESQDAIHYRGTPQVNTTDNLDVIFQAIIRHEALIIDYVRYKTARKCIQPIRLEIMDGHWYCMAWDIEKKAWRTYRCDHINVIHVEKNLGITFTKEEMIRSYQIQNQQYRTIPFKVQLTEKGKSQFLKRNYANMLLKEEKEQLFIIGQANKDEISFLANYFLGFGETVRIIEPDVLKEEYLRLLKSILSRY